MAKARPFPGQQPAERDVRSAVLSVFVRYEIMADATAARMRHDGRSKLPDHFKANRERWEAVADACRWIGGMIRRGKTLWVWPDADADGFDPLQIALEMAEDPADPQPMVQLRLAEAADAAKAEPKGKPRGRKT